MIPKNICNRKCILLNWKSLYMVFWSWSLKPVNIFSYYSKFCYHLYIFRGDSGSPTVEDGLKSISRWRYVHTTLQSFIKQPLRKKIAKHLRLNIKNAIYPYTFSYQFIFFCEQKSIFPPEIEAPNEISVLPVSAFLKRCHVCLGRIISWSIFCWRWVHATLSNFAKKCLNVKSGTTFEIKYKK